MEILILIYITLDHFLLRPLQSFVYSDHSIAAKFRLEFLAVRALCSRQLCAEHSSRLFAAAAGVLAAAGVVDAVLVVIVVVLVRWFAKSSFLAILQLLLL